MSESESDQGGAGRREVAYRLFAAEYEDADFSYSESDEERAPNYVVTPTGARVNRLFVVGVLTELEQVNDDVLRARIVDPTGAFVVYAGQYQPDEMAFLERADPPLFVSVTGKARTFQPDDSDVVYTSVRPESINEVDAETRDRWTVTTAERTLDRIATMAGALGREERGDELREVLEASGVDEGLASGTAMAIEHYGTTPTYLQALQGTALDAARVVAGDRDEVDSLSVRPDASGSATLSDLIDTEIAGTPNAGGEEATEPTTTPSSAEQSTAEATESASESVSTETGTTEATDDAVSTAETETADAEATTDDAVTGEDESAEVTTDSEPEPAEATSTETDSEPAVDSGGESPTAEPGTSSDAAVETATNAETEPTVEDRPVSDSGTDVDAGDSDEEDIGDFEPGEFEMEDDERERIEEEFGTDFSTGTEVEEPGEADIETPDPDPEPEPDAEPEPESASDPEPTTEPDAASEPDAATATESEAGSTAEPDPEPTAESEDDEGGDDATEEPAEDAADVDLGDAVMEAMRELNGGDGADREEIIASVVDQYGADPDAVEDAIQDALMDGRCYEPDDATLKPI
ncbi:hypothetical protein [Halorientalis salina]|uniref:hypothetical protein n=1 Tax=Halorientalis salina TaxID=2932266 RepID=UPI0010AD3688|nr:hypothetical protein [Halorientalis salina]